MSKVSGLNSTNRLPQDFSSTPAIKGKSDHTSNDKTTNDVKRNSDPPQQTYASLRGLDFVASQIAQMDRPDYGARFSSNGREIDFVDEDGNSRTGRVLRENDDDTVEIIENDKVYMVDKKTKKARGHRQATKAEMEWAAQMQQEQQIQEQQRQMEERRSEERREAIKDSVKREAQRKYELKINNQKVEQKRREMLYPVIEEPLIKS